MIAWFGDSITLGTRTGVADQQRFSYLVSQSRIAVELNAGVSGDGTTQGLARLQADVIAHAPEFCAVMFGTNDAELGNAHWVSSDQFKANLRSIVAQLLAADIRVMLMTPPLSTEASLEFALPPYLQAIRYLAHFYGCPLLDLHKLFSERSAAGIAGDFLDQWHPTPQGHQAIADLFNLPQHASICRVAPTVQSGGNGMRVSANIICTSGSYSVGPGAVNVVSVTKNATGDVTVNFAAALPDTNYVPNITSGDAGNFITFPRAKAQGSLRCGVRVCTAGTDIDASFVVNIP